MNLMKFTCTTLALLAVQACSPAPPATPEFGVHDLESQRISGAEYIRVPGASGFGDVTIRVTVDVNGAVVDARVARSDARKHASAALAVARQWRFRPQYFDGKPIQAVGVISVALRPLEIAPDTSVPFPTAAPEDVEIILDRSACFGTCPDYRLTVQGDGTIRFSSGRTNLPGTAAEVHLDFNGNNVLLSGTHLAKVSPKAVAALVEKFRAAHFMGMKPEYIAGITDNPTQVLSLRVGKTTKRVVDYVGIAVGMPQAVTELQDAVDRLADSDRWVRGNTGTVALLKAEGFDFRSREAATLVQMAILMNRWPPEMESAAGFLRAAIAQGLDLKATVDLPPDGRTKRSTSIGALIAGFAAETGNEALFDDMARQGQVAHMGKAALDAAVQTDMGCSPRIARALVAAGANPRAVGERGNALHAVLSNYGRCAKLLSTRRVEMASALVALGVALEARDDMGRTPLMDSNDPAIAQLLVKAGAKLNATDDGGTPVLLNLDDDRAVMVLLRAGANPNARGRLGTLRQKAREWHQPATLAWLDAHGIS